VYFIVLTILFSNSLSSY